MNNPLNLARSIGAIFIGFFALAGLDAICTALLLKYVLVGVAITTATPAQNFMLLEIKLLAGLLGGFLVATLAGTRRWQHAAILAALIFAIGCLGLLLMAGAPRSSYTFLALFISPLSILLGGWLRQRRGV